MTHEATLRLRFASADEAQRMAAALAPDDDGYLRVRVEGALLVLEAEAEAPLGLLRTLDEVLAQLSAAQKATRIARG
ncbi:MAG TPA: KEOPS complex subunit Pcc1 [Candidatus Thermoplasmatota archaeon]|nr:KEOPS complex subunit Pcc1 [Candidatus Thermoplasmatota archaeon]